MTCERRVYAFLTVVSLYCSIGSVNTATAGMHVTVNEDTLEMINQAEVSALRHDLNNKRFNDASGSSGSLDWKVSNIHVQYIGTMTPDINLQSTGQITWQCYITSIKVAANYRAKLSGWIPISTSGSIEASASAASLSISLALSENSGLLGIRLGGCSANVGRLNLRFTNNLLDGLFNTISDIFEDDIKDELQKSICEFVSEGMESITDDMKNIKMTLPVEIIGIPLTLDNAFTDITVTNDAISTYHKGAVHWYDRTFYSSNTSSFPTARTSHGISFDLKEDVFNNLLHTYVQSGNLNGMIDFQRVVDKGWDEFYLTCKEGSSGICFGNIVQQVAVLYPDRVLGMKWVVNSVNLNIQNSRITGELSGRVNCSADSNSESLPLFSALVELEIAFQLKFSDGIISAKASNWGGHATIDRSNIGKVLTPSLIEATNVFILPGLEVGILDIINDFKTHYAIELPKNVFIKDSNLGLYKGVVRIEADLCYKTTSCQSISNDVWVGKTDIPKFRVNDVITTTTTTTTTTPSTPSTTTSTITTTSTTVSQSTRADNLVHSGQKMLVVSIANILMCLIIVVTHLLV